MSYLKLQMRRVGPGELKDLHAILHSCGLDMKARLGLGHWDPPYPLHLLQRDAAEKEVYAVIDGEQTVATFTVGTQAPPYYELTVWAEPEGRALYVNRLAVLPEEQGRGIGRWCMERVEELARERECAFVRLDVDARHAALARFYERLGYERRDTIVPERSGETGLTCFEKRVGQ